MTNLSLKTAALAVLIALGSLETSSAHAAILRSSNGVPVLTHDGNCVITNWEGSDECEAAKAAAGLTGPVTTDSEQHVVHEGTVFFAFNKTTLTSEAKHSLDKLASELRIHAGMSADYHKRHRHPVHPMMQDNTLTIIGYADRIGKADYNQRLAMKRAQSVRTYLVSKGVKAKKIIVRSLGKTVPKASCSADLPRAKLINCLREDRRVEIEMSHK